MQLNPDGTLKLEWIEPDDDGLDPTWLELPDEEKWEQIRQFMRRGHAFVQRRNGGVVNLNVNKAVHYVDLP
jgi:hypothetical protein